MEPASDDIITFGLTYIWILGEQKSNKKTNMSYLDQVGVVVLCVQTSRDSVSGFPVYM